MTKCPSSPPIPCDSKLWPPLLVVTRRSFLTPKRGPLESAQYLFGIVTEFEFDTFEAQNQVTTTSLALNWLQNDAVDWFRTLQDLVTEAPKELNTVLLIVPASQTMDGAFYGDVAGLRSKLQLLLTHVETQETLKGA